MAQDVFEVTYTIEEAAKKLRIAKSSCYEAAKAGEIPSIRIGKRVLIPKAAFDSMLNAVASQSAK